MIDGNITGSKVEGSILILIFMNDDFVIYQVLSILLDGLIRSINITILPSIGKKKKRWFELWIKNWEKKNESIHKVMLLDKKKFDKAMPRNVRNTKNLYKFYHNSLCDELWVVKKSGEFGKNCVKYFWSCIFRRCRRFVRTQRVFFFWLQYISNLRLEAKAHMVVLRK